LVERQKVIEQGCEFYGYERNTKSNSNTHSAKVGSSAEKQKRSASNPARWWGRWKRRQGSRWTPKPGALDCVSSADALVRFFYTWL